MNFSRSMILWGTVLTLSGFCGVMPSVLADEDERTTAKDVVDSKTDMEYQDNLKKFVLSARDYFLGLPFSELLWLTIKDILQEEGGDWNYKSMYLVVLFPDGLCIRTAKIRVRTTHEHQRRRRRQRQGSRQGNTRRGRCRRRGRIRRVHVGRSGHGRGRESQVLLRHQRRSSPVAPQEFILVGGYHHNVTSTEDETEALPEFPEVSAQDVRDRETLKAFVQGAGDWALRALPTLSFDLPKLKTEFRREGGHWRHGSTYIFAMTPDGNVIFHGSRPDLEGQILIDLEDRNGFQFVSSH